MRTWLRRWLGVEQLAAPVTEPITALEKRFDQLEEHVQYLHMSLRKLRGRVTGALRNPDPAGSDGEPVSDAPPTTRGNPAAIELLRKRGRIG
jgi:hypothetical protein